MDADHRAFIFPVSAAVFITMNDKIARVQWKMGQALLPEHFTAQEDALLADVLYRFRATGLPFYGISELKWNETLLAEGILSIQAMTLIMPSGLLLALPGNAAASPFNLSIPGSVNVAVFCHVLNQTAVEPATDAAWGDETENRIPRVLYQLDLSADPSHPDALMTLKLAEFDKDPEGRWRLSDRYVPPLVRTGTAPFLKDALRDISRVLELFQYNLTLDAASYLSGESLFSVKQCLKSVYRTQRFLANIDAQIHAHPYHLYEMLLNLYTEVCFYKNTAPENITAPYRHDDFASCFLRIVKPLKEQMQAAKTRSPYLPFSFRDNVYRIGLPQEIKEAKQIYFLVQKSHVNLKFPAEHLKLAGFSRLSLIHKMALQGVPVRKTDRPSFQHAFGPEVDFYLLIEGEEWDYALQELSLAFYHHAQFKDMEFYLYWR